MPAYHCIESASMEIWFDSDKTFDKKSQKRQFAENMCHRKSTILNEVCTKTRDLFLWTREASFLKSKDPVFILYQPVHFFAEPSLIVTAQSRPTLTTIIPYIGHLDVSTPL